MASTAAPPPTPSKLSPTTVRNAVTALLKHRAAKTAAQKPDLLDSDEPISLIFTLAKIPPKVRVNAFKLPLPTPLHSTQLTEFCLIFDDRPKSKITKDLVKSKVKADSLPITKIIRFSKLKSDFKAFESKRKLLNSYDMFLADKQIVPLLPRHLGKKFFKKKRIPVPIDLLKKNWKEQIERVCCSAQLYLSTGTCCVVKVARTGMSVDEIVGNVVAAVDGAVGVVEGGWKGVRSFHLKLMESVALPVYQTVPEAVVPRVEEVKEVVKSESGKKEKVGKKGRIHEVRYLDGNAGSDVVVEGKADENVGLGGANSGKKKKKKDKAVGEESVKVSESKELGGGGELSKKRKKEKSVGEVSAIDQEGSGEKKRKKENRVGEPNGKRVKGSGEAGTKKPIEKVDEESDLRKPVLKKSAKAKDVDVESVGVKEVKKVSTVKPKKDESSVGGLELRTSNRKKVIGSVDSRVEKPMPKIDEESDLRKPVTRKSAKAKAEDAELNGEKQLKKVGTLKPKKDDLSANEKKKEVTKKKGVAKESVAKEKRKSEPVKLTGGEEKLQRAKRSKKAA